MGVPPERVVDFQALVGDSSDNIGGVRGVGPKAACALLQSFGDLEKVYSNLERVQYVSVRGAKGLARKLEAGRDDAMLARRFVRKFRRIHRQDSSARCRPEVRPPVVRRGLWPSWRARASSACSRSIGVTCA